jgi:hypothetical protein
VALELTALAWMIGFAAILIAQRSIDRRAWATWDRLRNWNRGQVHGLRDSLQRRRSVIALAVRAAETEHAHGDRGRALRMLRASSEALEGLVSDLRTWLREWSDTAQALLALAPVPDPRVGALRLQRLRVLAFGWRVAHAFALSRRDRLILRAFVVGHGLRLLQGFWRATRLPRGATTSWPRARALELDLAALSEASLETYESVLVACRAGVFAERTR